MRDMLNRKKIIISDFYFSSYGHFCDVITPIFDAIFTIYRKIKLGNFFNYLFQSASSIERIKTDGGEGGWGSLLILSWEAT